MELAKVYRGKPRQLAKPIEATGHPCWEMYVCQLYALNYMAKSNLRVWPAGHIWQAFFGCHS